MVNAFGQGLGFPFLDVGGQVFIIPNRDECLQAFNFAKPFYNSTSGYWELKDFIGKVDRTPTKGDVYNFQDSMYVDFSKTDIDFSGVSFLDISMDVLKESGEIIGMGQSDDADNRFDFLWFSDDRIYVALANGSNSYGYVSLSSDFGKRKTLRFVYDGSGVANSDRLKVYVDGVLQVLTFVGTIPSSLPTFTDTLKFGDTNGGASYSEGLLGNVRMCDSSGDLLHSYHCDENGSTVCFDSVGNANGVITGADSTFFEQSILFDSFKNEIGFTSDVSSDIPLRLDSSGVPTGLDVNGSVPTYFGRTRLNVKLVNNFCANPDGSNDLLAFSDLSGITVVSNEGTSVASVSGNNIVFTAGTCWNIVLSNGSVFNLNEGSGKYVYDSSVNNLRGVVTNANLVPDQVNSFWAPKSSATPNNYLKGCSSSLYCRTRGNTWKKCNNAYGEWEFGFVKNSASWVINRIFISGDNTVFPNYDSAYAVYIDGNEAITLYKFNSSTLTVLFKTSNAFVSIGTPYMIKVVRNSSLNEYVTGGVGTFGVYIKGGSYGDDYVLMSVGTGSNPVLDNTYTDSSFCGLSMDASDLVFSLSHNGVKEVVENYVDDVSLGVYDVNFIPASSVNTFDDVFGFSLSNPAGSWHNGCESTFEQYEVPELYYADYGNGTEFTKYWFGLEKLDGLARSGDFEQVGKYEYANDGVSDDSPYWTNSGDDYVLGTKVLFVYQITDYVSGSIVPRLSISNTGTSVSENGIFGEVIEVTSYNSTYKDRVGFRGSSFVGNLKVISIKLLDDESVCDVPHYKRDYDVYSGYESHTNFSDAEQNKWRRNLLYETEQSGDDLTKIYNYINKP